MDREFWLQRWCDREIAFHEGRANALLQRHYSEMALKTGDRIFLPLCGKTQDIAWFAARSHRIVGVELSRDAVRELFDELGLQPEVSRRERYLSYRAGDIEVFVGDFFALSPAILGPVQGIYDRAALVALPAEMRRQYAQLLPALTGNATQLLISFDYEQDKMDGPPFAVSEDEIRSLYGERYRLKLLESRFVEGGLKGLSPIFENAWLLSSR